MDGIGMLEFGLIAATLTANWMVDRGVRYWHRSENERRRQEATKVLKAHEMEAHTYLPSFSAETGELRDALGAFDFTSKVVLDRDGRLVGRVLSKAQAQGKGGLRLVVDNTK